MTSIYTETLLSAVSPTLKYIGGISLQNPHQFSILRGKTYAVVGSNGSGKSTLSRIIENGWNFSTNHIIGNKSALNIKRIEFSDIHSLTGFSGAYYQQRFESMANDDIPTVQQFIDSKMNSDIWNDLCKRLNATDITSKRINYLSSGELRKFLIINALTTNPDLLIIDNPYIGLDKHSRKLFNQLLQDASANGTTIMLLLCNPHDMPDFTDFVTPMSNLTIGETRNILPETFCDVTHDLMNLFPSYKTPPLLSYFQPANQFKFSTAFALNHCDITYGKHIILHDVNWEIKAGEKWALLGENGSGKSTLLSLVCCDNPQGYSNDICIFDHKRGTGESIWDIKCHIAYISPEMHLYFNGNKQTLDVVASGLHDKQGLYVRPTKEQYDEATQWMKLFGISELSNRRFNTLSSGEQRLALLVRTFIKRAPLLILDEPLHGLDISRKRFLNDIIQKITSSNNVTLVYVTHYVDEIPATVHHTFSLTKFRDKSLQPPER